MSKKHLYEIDSDMYKINLFKSLNEIEHDEMEIWKETNCRRNVNPYAGEGGQSILKLKISRSCWLSVYEGGGNFPTNSFLLIIYFTTQNSVVWDRIVYICVIPLAVEFISFQMFHFGSGSVQRRSICTPAKANPFFPFCHYEMKSEFVKAWDCCHFMTNGRNCFPESRIDGN